MWTQLEGLGFSSKKHDLIAEYNNWNRFMLKVRCKDYQNQGKNFKIDTIQSTFDTLAHLNLELLGSIYYF